MGRDFTPALGRPRLTGLYDAAVRLLTRERRWRSMLLDQVAPTACESIVDVGCGTGSFAVMLKRRAPKSHVVGLDPDPNVLAIARQKAARTGVEVEWRQGFARDVVTFGREFDKAVSSLVFHQVPLLEKEVGIAAMFAAVRPGGEVHIADYAVQHRWLMRQLFRVIQWLDGPEDTQANVDGAIERILASLQGHDVQPRSIVYTPTGAISLFKVEVSGRSIATTSAGVKDE